MQAPNASGLALQWNIGSRIKTYKRYASFPLNMGVD